MKERERAMMWEHKSMRKKGESGGYKIRDSIESGAGDYCFLFDYYFIFETKPMSSILQNLR